MRTDGVVVGAHVCTDCPGASPPALASAQALAQHRRMSHGVRNDIRSSADRDGVCGACGSVFENRLRLLKHIMHSKRISCCAWLRLHGKKLSSAHVATLDAEDRLSTVAAYRLGASIAPAIVGARDRHGRALGRARAAG